MNAVTLESVCFRYPGTRKGVADALRNVTLQIPNGSFFALLGENGAGKTTLMRLVCGRLVPSAGSIFFDESLVGAKNFGALIENPGDYPRLTVEEYLLFFGKLYGVCNLKNRIREVLGELDFQFDLNLRVGALSLGNRQKLQVARAILHKPKILLLDEPAANLDPVARESLWNALSRWRMEQGGTLIVTSHILPELDKFATHFAIVKRGAIAMQGEMPQKENSSALHVAERDLEAARIALKNAGIETYSEESTLTELYKKAMV